MTRTDSARINDVAALAGVSKTTVSNVINSPSAVAGTTRRRVERAIALLGWVPNESARRLRAGHSRSIGIIVPDFTDPSAIAVITTVEEVLLERGCFVQVTTSGHDQHREHDQLQMFAREQALGALVIPVPGGEAATFPRPDGLPVVLLDPPRPPTDACSVATDVVAGHRLAVQHLLDRGHEVIGLVGTDHVDPRLASIPIDRLDAVGGAEVAVRLSALPHGRRPTAVLAVTDLVALGLLQGFLDAGLRVPQDMAILGYGDVGSARAAVPLSSVRPGRAELARTAVDLLLAEIDAADRQHPHDHVSIMIRPDVMARRSTDNAWGP